MNCGGAFLQTVFSQGIIGHAFVLLLAIAVDNSLMPVLVYTKEGRSSSQLTVLIIVELGVATVNVKPGSILLLYEICPAH